MKRGWITPVCFLLGWAPLAFGADPPPSRPAAGHMELEEIKPGMKGVGRTVLRGTTIEEFGVEILGVLDSSLPDGDMILAKLSGLGLEKTGVLAGMSGSPIYIDGRLIGALAFSWPFATEPITGITPVSVMRGLGKRVEESEPVPRGGMSHELWEALWRSPADQAIALLTGGPSPASGDAVPLMVPLLMSGFGPTTLEAASNLLGPMGLLPAQGGSSGGETSPEDSPLEAGAAVGVELVRGDAHVAAIGTVTWVDGDRVFAFGHRVLNLGRSAYPMTAVDVVSVMPRANTSFKMGVTGKTLGMFTGDYNAGALGEIGKFPTLIPVDVTMDFRDREEKLHFEILDAEALTPVLTGLVAVNSMESLGRAAGAGTLRITTGVSLADGRTVRVKTAVAGFAPPMALGGEVARVVGLLHGNPFEPTRVSRVSITASLENEIQAAFLDEISVAPRLYRPGDVVSVTLGLRDYRGNRWSHQVRLNIPSDIAPGAYKLVVCGGAEAQRLDQERAPTRYAPQSLDQLVEILENGLPNDHVVVRLIGGSTNPVVLGRELPRLPRSLRSVVASTSTGGRTGEAAATVFAEQSENLAKIVLGCETLDLNLAKRR